MSPKSSKSKTVPAKAAAPKKLKTPMRKKSAAPLTPDAEKFLVDDGIKLPAPALDVPPESVVADLGSDPETALVSDVMTRQTLYCYADQSAVEVRDIMRLHEIRRLPVVDPTMRIIGIVFREAIEKITEPKKK